jgi:FtsZ-binding cell division protein ZapB
MRIVFLKILNKVNLFLVNTKRLDYPKLLELLKQPNASTPISISPIRHTSLTHIQKKIYESKNSLTDEMHTRLRNIFETQAQVGRVGKKVNTWVSVLRSLIGKFANLEVKGFSNELTKKIVTHLPLAYDVGMLEIMRRRRVERKMNNLIENSNQKLEKMRHTETEMRRR